MSLTTVSSFKPHSSLKASWVTDLISNMELVKVTSAYFDTQRYVKSTSTTTAAGTRTLVDAGGTPEDFTTFINSGYGVYAPSYYESVLFTVSSAIDATTLYLTDSSLNGGTFTFPGSTPYSILNVNSITWTNITTFTGVNQINYALSNVSSTACYRRFLKVHVALETAGSYDSLITYGDFAKTFSITPTGFTFYLKATDSSTLTFAAIGVSEIGAEVYEEKTDNYINMDV